MLYGKELIEKLQNTINSNKETINNRFDRISDGSTDMDDCFVSQHFDEMAISEAEKKIKLINNGGAAWFNEYATLDGQLVNSAECITQYGWTRRFEMPNGEVVFSSAHTAKGLAKKGLKEVRCLRPAWYEFKSCGTGMMGAYSGDYVLVPSDVNYATGEKASEEPIKIEEI